MKMTSSVKMKKYLCAETPSWDYWFTDGFASEDDTENLGTFPEEGKSRAEGISRGMWNDGTYFDVVEQVISWYEKVRIGDFVKLCIEAYDPFCRSLGVSVSGWDRLYSDC